MVSESDYKYGFQKSSCRPGHKPHPLGSASDQVLDITFTLKRLKIKINTLFQNYISMQDKLLFVQNLFKLLFSQFF